MYITITGSKNNKDVYIYQSFRKEDGRPSSRIYKKLGKYNALLEEFNGDKDKLMAWAKNEAAKETDLYNQHNGKVIVEFSQASCIPLNEARSFYAGYLFLQELCTELRLDNICRVIKRRHSLKKKKKEDRETAMDPKQFRKIGSADFVDLTTLDETDESVFNSIYYKEVPVVTGDMDETLIVTYSPKYKAYQKKVRAHQIERAEKIIQSSGAKRKGKNQNDPMRFVKKTSITEYGEIAEKKVYELDAEQIAKEKLYDGFYAVITNLEGDVGEIIKINKQRWEIEENFRIMKTELEARPVYVRRDDRIKAHFMTCYISLLLYRLLEQKLTENYTAEQLIATLRSMKLTLLNTANGYIPSYTRTEITDTLHKAFGFRTDYEFIKKSTMRSIIKQTKKLNFQD